MATLAKDFTTNIDHRCLLTPHISPITVICSIDPGKKSMSAAYEAIPFWFRLLGSDSADFLLKKCVGELKFNL